MTVSFPMWSLYLGVGLGLFGLLVCTSIIAGRAGRSPYFALLMIIPFAQIIAVWLFAFKKWPKFDV